MAYGSKSGGMKKAGGKKGFKPCAGCPTPAACKRMGKCRAKMGKK
jgi:hypothetical protein